jgi:hypothetical protein
VLALRGVCGTIAGYMGVAGVLAMIVLAAPPVESVESGAVGLRAPGYYLHVAPGVMTFLVPRTEYFGYLWGVGGGRYFTRPGRLAFSVGGFAEHLVITTPPAYLKSTSVFDGLFHFVRTGPELRVGASNERVFGYGLARLGLDLLLAQPGGFYELQGLFTLGGGVQGALGTARRLLLGIEPALEISFPTPWPLARVRAFIGVRF